MLSGCELIDTENISLPSQNMKFVSERSERVTNFIFCHLDKMGIERVHCVHRKW
jgi:hypothetical protein